MPAAVSTGSLGQLRPDALFLPARLVREDKRKNFLKCFTGFPPLRGDPGTRFRFSWRSCDSFSVDACVSLCRVRACRFGHG
jgi:hypothetical protein